MENFIRVLIVDDHEPWRQWLRSKLGDTGGIHIAEEAGDGIDALAKARDVNPHLVLLDVGMPGLSGFETAPLLRKILHHAKIIFLSQEDDPDLVRAALDDGASGYVLKAEAERKLLPAIQAAFLNEL